MYARPHDLPLSSLSFCVPVVVAMKAICVHVCTFARARVWAQSTHRGCIVPAWPQLEAQHVLHELNVHAVSCSGVWVTAMQCVPGKLTRSH